MSTPQQNDLSEHKNRRLLEVARALMLNSNVPKCFWGDAILTACYLINRVPSQVLHFQFPLTLLSNSVNGSRYFSDLEFKSLDAQPLFTI